VLVDAWSIVDLDLSMKLYEWAWWLKKRTLHNVRHGWVNGESLNLRRASRTSQLEYADSKRSRVKFL